LLEVRLVAAMAVVVLGVLELAQDLP